MVECVLCNDTGVLVKENNSRVKCDCIVKKEIYAYLTFRYATIPHEEKISDKIYNGKSLYFTRDKDNNLDFKELEKRFNAIVKGKLIRGLREGKKFSHATYTSEELLDFNFAPGTEFATKKAIFADNDFIIIKLIYPLKNSLQHTLFTSYIYNLLNDGKCVWVLCDKKTFGTRSFDEIFGEELRKMLENENIFKKIEIMGRSN